MCFVLGVDAYVNNFLSSAASAAISWGVLTRRSASRSNFSATLTCIGMRSMGQ